MDTFGYGKGWLFEGVDFFLYSFLYSFPKYK